MQLTLKHCRHGHGDSFTCLVHVLFGGLLDPVIVVADTAEDVVVSRADGICVWRSAVRGDPLDDPGVVRVLSEEAQEAARVPDAGGAIARGGADLAYALRREVGGVADA